MKYIIKCSYCDKTYTVNTFGAETDFICSSCGGANGMENVVERITVSQKIKSKGKSDPIMDTNMDTINSFEMKEHKVKNPIMGIILTIVILVVLGMFMVWVDLPTVCLILLLPLGFMYLYNFYSSDMPEMPTIETIENNLKKEQEELEDEMNPWYSEMQHEDEFTRNLLNEFNSKDV